MSKINFFLVNKDNVGRRLDNFLFSKFKKSIPKSKIYSSIRKAKIKVNNKKTRPDYKLKDQDEIKYPEFILKAELNDSPNLDNHIKIIKDAIIYDSKNFVVLNKPPNYAVHGGSGLNFGVIEIIRKIYKHSEDFNLAHRIDKSTSGCLIIAKKMSALRAIHKQFRDKSVKKVYQCIVFGKWPPELKTISNKLISKKTAGKEHKTFKAKDGKESVTNFKVEFSFKEFTQLRAKPKTGRTHQIRFHCFDSGFPIVGDKKYFLGESKGYSKRLMLHAKEISFIDGSEKVVIKTKDDYGLSDFRKNL